MNKDKLRNAGVDYDEGVERFAGQAHLYEKYVAKFFAGDLMETLTAKLAAKDVPGAFRAAHDLKGAAGNLSLNAFYAEICKLTELLRNGDAQGDYTAALTACRALYDVAKQAAGND